MPNLSIQGEYYLHHTCHVLQSSHIDSIRQVADLHKAIVALKEANIEEFQVTELEMIPQSEVVLEGDDLATFEKLYDALDDDEDVQKIYTNVDGF